MLVSYERAKAESLGYDARGGLMERAERLGFLALGLLFESLLVPVLWVSAIGASLSFLPVLFSPVRTLREIPAQAE